jgi:hypothetical protein
VAADLCRGGPGDRRGGSWGRIAVEVAPFKVTTAWPVDLYLRYPGKKSGLVRGMLEPSEV